MPKILFIGGEKGSWEVRGRQIAGALGGKVTVRPSKSDFAWAEVIVLVKQAADRWGQNAKATGCPLIWDALDFWKQPQENQRTPAELLADVHRRRMALRVRLIGATKVMAQQIGGAYIPHHARPGVVATPPRARLDTVAYEGRVKYLGSWNAALERACTRLGARFVINPPSLSDADVVVAFRGEHWDGWACRQWKSGVKYVNALTAGRPVVTQQSAAFDEIRPVGVITERQDQLDEAILKAWGQRKQAYITSQRRRGEFLLQTIAVQYRSLVKDVVRWAA